MSDEDESKRIAEETARRQREADLVDNRIRELWLDPIKGNFDAAHLKAVHADIFQDTPHHRPGVVREDTKNWTKHRSLEGQRGVYDVPYVGRGVEGRIAQALKQFGGPDAITLDMLRKAAGERTLEAIIREGMSAGHGLVQGRDRPGPAAP